MKAGPLCRGDEFPPLMKRRFFGGSRTLPIRLKHPLHPEAKSF